MIPGTGAQVQIAKEVRMNEALPKASMVDLDRLGQDIGQETPPSEVAKFAPSKYRQPSSLGQTLNELKKWANDMQREQEENTRRFKQQIDELLRIIG